MPWVHSTTHLEHGLRLAHLAQQRDSKSVFLFITSISMSGEQIQRMLRGVGRLKSQSERVSQQGCKRLKATVIQKGKKQSKAQLNQDTALPIFILKWERLQH